MSKRKTKPATPKKQTSDSLKKEIRNSLRYALEQPLDDVARARWIIGKLDFKEAPGVTEQRCLFIDRNVSDRRPVRTNDVLNVGQQWADPAAGEAKCVRVCLNIWENMPTDGAGVDGKVVPERLATIFLGWAKMLKAEAAGVKRRSVRVLAEIDASEREHAAIARSLKISPASGPPKAARKQKARRDQLPSRSKESKKVQP